MTFNRKNLPDTQTYFEEQGLVLTGHGKWRTTSCTFHDGSDSMRINLASGGWCCMSCGEKGGDVLAYHIKANQLCFIDAAKELGCWIDDGHPEHTRPTPLSPRDALAVLAREATLIAVTTGNMRHGVPLTDNDFKRLLEATGRINHIAGSYAQ
jgi:hypothetical protein